MAEALTQDDLLARPEGRISATFAGHYDECPKAAQLSREVKAVGAPLSRGTLLHDFAAAVVARCYARDETGIGTEEAVELMDMMLADTTLAIPLSEQDTLRKLAVTFALSHEFDPYRIVDLESEHSTVLEGSVQLKPGQERTPFAVDLVGRMDLVELVHDTVIVTDYKTAWAVDPESAIRGTVQGRVYAVLAFDRFPDAQRVKLVWDYVRFGEKGIREVTIDRTELAELRHGLELVAARIVHARDAENWPAVPGDHCARCPAPDRCPILLADRRDGAPIDRAMATSYAKQARAMDTLVSLRKKQLKAYVKEHGPVDIDGGTYAFTIGEDTYRIDENSKAAMEEADIDWRAFAKPVKASSRFGFQKEKS